MAQKTARQVEVGDKVTGRLVTAVASKAGMFGEETVYITLACRSARYTSPDKRTSQHAPYSVITVG